MAYEYDQFGNVIGEYESDEERKRRLDAEQANTPVKQTITTNPDGTQEMTIKGTPQALSPMNPNTPTVSGPVTPDETFRRMQQIESGNRDFDAQGRPIRSPAGAMYKNQVMPATARNPGYGIAPARDESPEEYNRVGREYYQAMLQKFGGDKAAAAAAYNAGPGRVERNMQANAGTMNVQQLPRETQGYLQKLGNAVSSVIPSAQAATPQSFAQDTANRRAQTQYVPGLNARDDLMLRQPPTQAISPAASAAQAQPLPDSIINDQVAAYERRQPLNLPDDAYQQYLNLPDNPKDRLAYAYDPNTPENLSKHIKKQVSDTLAHEAGFTKAQTQVQTMDENAVARALREKTTGGSYVKAILFGLLGMERSAMAEAAKLGIGNETMALLGNDPVMVKVAANGTPISGINAKTGKELTAQELIAATQGAQVVKGTEVEAGTYMDPTGTVPGNWVLERRPGGSVYRQVGTNAIASPEQANALRKTGVGGTLGDQRAKMIQEINLKLQGKTQEEAMAILRPYNQALAGAQQPIISPNELNIAAPQISGGTSAATAGTGAVGGGTSTGGAGAGAATGGAAAGKRPTMDEIEAKKEANKVIVTDAAKQVAASADTQNMIKSIDKITKLIDSGEHNIGSIGSTIAGRGRVAQFFGEIGETDDAKNTKIIMDTVQKLAADGLKALGSNPSTIDLEFWTKFKPQATDNPEFVREWIQSRSEDLKRRLGYAGAQVSAGGQAGTAPAAEAELSPQERAKQELARRKKKD
jgi:hypothetical protein